MLNVFASPKCSAFKQVLNGISVILIAYLTIIPRAYPKKKNVQEILLDLGDFRFARTTRRQFNGRDFSGMLYTIIQFLLKTN